MSNGDLLEDEEEIPRWRTALDSYSGGQEEEEEEGAPGWRGALDSYSGEEEEAAVAPEPSHHVTSESDVPVAEEEAPGWRSALDAYSVTDWGVHPGPERALHYLYDLDESQIGKVTSSQRWGEVSPQLKMVSEVVEAQIESALKLNPNADVSALREEFYKSAKSSYDNTVFDQMRAGSEDRWEGDTRRAERQPISPDTIASLYIMATEGFDDITVAHAALVLDRRENGGAKYSEILEKIKDPDQVSEVLTPIHAMSIQKQTESLEQFAEAQSGVEQPKFRGSKDSYAYQHLEHVAYIGNWLSLEAYGREGVSGLAEDWYPILKGDVKVADVDQGYAIPKYGDAPMGLRTEERSFREVSEAERKLEQEQAASAPGATVDQKPIEKSLWEKRRKTGGKKKVKLSELREWRTMKDGTSGYYPKGWSVVEDFSPGFRAGGNPTWDDIKKIYVNEQLAEFGPGGMRAVNVAELSRKRKGQYRKQTEPTPYPVQSYEDVKNPLWKGQGQMTPSERAAREKEINILSLGKQTKLGKDAFGEFISRDNVEAFDTKIRAFLEETGLETGQLLPTRVFAQGEEQEIIKRFADGSYTMGEVWDIGWKLHSAMLSRDISDELAEEAETHRFLGISYDRMFEEGGKGDPGRLDFLLEGLDMTFNGIAARVGSEVVSMAKPLFGATWWQQPGSVGQEFEMDIRGAEGKFEDLTEAAMAERGRFKVEELLKDAEGVRAASDGTVQIYELPDGKYEVEITPEGALTREEIAKLPEDTEESSLQAEAFKKSSPYRFTILNLDQLKVVSGDKVKAGSLLFSGVSDLGMTPVQAQVQSAMARPSKQMSEWFDKGFARRFDGEEQEELVPLAFMSEEEANAYRGGGIDRWDRMGLWNRIQAEPERFAVNLARNALETVAMVPLLGAYGGYRYIKGMGTQLDRIAYLDEELWGDGPHDGLATTMRAAYYIAQLPGVPLAGLGIAGEAILFEDIPKIPAMVEYLAEEASHPNRFFFNNPLDALGIASMLTMPAKFAGRKLFQKGTLSPYEKVLSRSGITFKDGKFMRGGEVLVDMIAAAKKTGRSRVAAYAPLLEAMPRTYREQLENLVASVRPRHLAAAMRYEILKSQRKVFGHKGMRQLAERESDILQKQLTKEQRLKKDYLETRAITEIEAIGAQRTLWMRTWKKSLRTTGTLLEAAHDVWDPIQALVMGARVGYGIVSEFGKLTSGSPDLIRIPLTTVRQTDEFGRSMLSDTGRKVPKHKVDFELARLRNWFRSPLNALDTYGLRSDGTLVNVMDIFKSRNAAIARGQYDAREEALGFPGGAIGEDAGRILKYEYDNGTEFYIAVHEHMLADTPYGRARGMGDVTPNGEMIPEGQRAEFGKLRDSHGRVMSRRATAHEALRNMEEALARLPQKLRDRVRRWQSGLGEFPRRSKLVDAHAEDLAAYKEAAKAHKKAEDVYEAEHTAYVDSSIEYNKTYGRDRYTGRARLPSAENLGHLMKNEPVDVKVVLPGSVPGAAKTIADSKYLTHEEMWAARFTRQRKKHAKEKAELQEELRVESEQPLVDPDELKHTAPDERGRYEMAAQEGRAARHAERLKDLERRHGVEFDDLSESIKAARAGTAHQGRVREVRGPAKGQKEGAAAAQVRRMESGLATYGRGVSVREMAVSFARGEIISYVPAMHASMAATYKMWKELRKRVGDIDAGATATKADSGLTRKSLDEFAHEWGFNELDIAEQDYLAWVSTHMDATTLQNATGVYAARLPRGGETVHVQQLEKPLQVASQIRMNLMNEGAKLVETGVLPSEVYLANVGTYFPHLYTHAKKHFDGLTNQSEWERGIQGDRMRKERLRELSEEQKLSKGLVDNYRVRYAMGIAQMKQDLEMAKLYHELGDAKYETGPWEGYRLAEYAEAGSREAKGFKNMGWKQIPKGRKWGSLSEKWVAPEMDYYLRFSNENAGAVMKRYRKVLNSWKFGKTVLNPATHGRNVISNMCLSTMAGLNPWVYKSAKFGWKGTRSDVWNKRGEWYERAREDGLLGTDQFSVEMQGMMAEMFEPNWKPMGDIANEFDASLEMVNEVLSWGERAAQKAGNVNDWAVRAYQFEDEVFKVARYKQLWHLWEEFQSKGKLTSEMKRMFDSKDDAVKFMTMNKADMRIAAGREAQKWFFDYSNVSGAVDWARTYWAPFVTFQVKALPRISAWIHKNPLKAFAYRKVFDSTNFMLEYMDGSPESIEEYRLIEQHRASLPSYARIAATRLPGAKTYEYAGGENIGAMRWLDVQYWTPAGGVMSPDLSWKLSGWEEVVANQNPLVPVFGMYFFNRPPWDMMGSDPMVDNSVDFWSWERQSEYLKEAGKIMLPPLTPFVGSGYHKFAAAWKDEPYPNTMKGRMLDMPEALVDSVGGIRVYKTRLDLDHMDEIKDEFVDRRRELTKKKNEDLRVPGVKGNPIKISEIEYKYYVDNLEVDAEWARLLDRIAYDATLKTSVWGKQKPKKEDVIRWRETQERTGQVDPEAMEYLLSRIR